MGILPLDAMAIQNSERVRSQLLRGIAGRSNEPSETSRQVRSPGSTADASSLFAQALGPARQGAIADVDSRFTRSSATQKKSEVGILGEVKKRQPGAEVEYARVFGQQDLAKLFDKAVQGYGLRNNDIADTMAAY